MNTSRRIVLTLSPELYGRLEARAAEGRLDDREWAQRVLPAALSAPESKAIRGYTNYRDVAWTHE